MKILMLNYEFPPIGGGAGKAHLCLLKEFAKNSATEYTDSIEKSKIVIDVLTSAPEAGFTKEQFSDNITIYKVGVHKKNLHFWRRAEIVEWLVKAKLHYRRLLTTDYTDYTDLNKSKIQNLKSKIGKYDLIHVFFGIPTGLLCLPRPKCPYIVSLRGSDVPGENIRFSLDYKIFGLPLKKIWKSAASLVACSEGLKQRGLRFMPDAKINVIPNGIESDVFKPEDRGQKTENRRQKLITVGRLSATKRIGLLIEAAELLKKQGRDISLTIVGGGGGLAATQQIVAERNLDSFIHVLGRVPNEKMPNLYREHGMFVSATMQEGMSNAMLEAMASGLPIVTTRCEGVEELLCGSGLVARDSMGQRRATSDERRYTIADNGIIAENATARDIAEAIKRIIDDAEIYERMSKAARARAEQFSWRSVAERYLDCYHQAIQRTGV